MKERKRYFKNLNLLSQPSLIKFVKHIFFRPPIAEPLSNNFIISFNEAGLNSAMLASNA
jgi:hypothetical protein